MAETEPRKAFKDYFDRAAAKALARQVATAYPPFDRAAFVRQASTHLDALEFQGRVQQFSDALRKTLPDSVEQSLAILTGSLPAPLPDCEAVTDGWLQWPLGQFIADHGLDHFDASMEAMVALTKRFSSEFAVRPFIEQRPDETFARLRALTRDENPHVRRWCSEGCRPRLPWGKRLTALVNDPSPILPILEALKDDPEEYVWRSVANNLNDIAKDHSKLVVERCRAWKGGPPSRARLVKHALRSLIKAGDPSALRLSGFVPPKGLQAQLSLAPKRVAIGDPVVVRAKLSHRGRRSQPVLVDYVVHYVLKNGGTGEKVLKWATTTIDPDQTVEIRKQHRFRPTTVRRLYPGRHVVELQVNGVRVAKAHVTLTGTAAKAAPAR